MRMHCICSVEETNEKSKRLDGSGRFQWPANAGEARQLTRQQFRWLTEGLSIDQPKAIHAGDKRKDF